MQARRIDGLPADPLDAAAAFHAHFLPGLCGQEDDLLLIFPPADHTHRAWRLAAVQGLARRSAPLRVNAVAADSDAAIEAAQAYLTGAPGLTGQYLALDGVGAGDVIPLAR